MNFLFYLALPFLVGLVLVQTAVFPQFRQLAVVPELILLLTVAWALVGDVTMGILLAFLGGLLLDITSISPVGLRSLALLAAVLVAVLLQRLLPESRYLIPMLLMGLATFVYHFAYYGLLLVDGYPWAPTYGGIIIPQSVLHTGLMLPTFWLLNRLDQLVRPRPLREQ